MSWELFCSLPVRYGCPTPCNSACNSLTNRISSMRTEITVVGIACGFCVLSDRVTSCCVVCWRRGIAASGFSCAPACASPTTSACEPRSPGADRGTCDPPGRARIPSRRRVAPHPRRAKTAGPCSAAPREPRTGERRQPRPRR